MLAQQISLLAPVVEDAVPWGAEFGDVVEDVAQQVVSPGEWGCCSAVVRGTPSRFQACACNTQCCCLEWLVNSRCHGVCNPGTVLLWCSVGLQSHALPRHRPALRGMHTTLLLLL
jgi:hypothetical protein